MDLQLIATTSVYVVVGRQGVYGRTPLEYISWLLVVLSFCNWMYLMPSYLLPRSIPRMLHAHHYCMFNKFLEMMNHKYLFYL